MLITGLDIRDFGVFQGEKLEDLSSGIIVIGGSNRSGKTTLMQILRSIPFGFSRSNNLPPAKFQYDVRCDLELEDGQSAKVLLKGFSNPDIIYNSATDRYNNKGLCNIDKNTYKELFTISLDELNRSSDKEDSNLQSILLGAGFKHIIKIPGIAKQLREKANVIGGTRGNPSTKMFKPFAENIRKGVEGRKESILLFDSFSKKKNSLAGIENVILINEIELQNSNNNIIKLEVLKHNYELNQSRKNLEIELKTYSFSDKDINEYNVEKAKSLKTHYIKELELYNNDNFEYQRQTTENKLEKELLLQNKTPISNFYNRISGTKENIKTLLVVKNEYHEKSGTLMNKIKKSNDNWVSFEDVSEINCDEMQQAILTGNIEKFKKVEVDIAACNKRIQDFKIQKEILGKQMLPLNSLEYMKKYFYFTIGFMIIGFVLFFIDKLLGCSLMIIGSIGTALYLFINYSNSKIIINRNIEIKAQIDNMSAGLSDNSQEIKNLDENLRELNNIMDEYRDILKLDGRVTADGIKDYFKTASYLKDEISEYCLLEKKLMGQFKTLCEYLTNINKLFNKFVNVRLSETEQFDLDNIEYIGTDVLLKVETLYRNLLLVEKNNMGLAKLFLLEQEILEFLKGSHLVSNYADDIISKLEKYISQGEKYIKYTIKQNELKIIKEKLLQVVKSQHIKKILLDEKKGLTLVDNIETKSESETINIEDENTKLLEILKGLYEQYISIDELCYDYEVLNTENKKLVSQLDILKNEKQTLKDELKALNSDEMLVKHEQEIREARLSLRPLAEKYAVYNTAALLLEKIRERFLVNTKDKLLKGASDILSEITSGEYKDIMPMEDLMQGDFKTKLQDESIKGSSKELSRGTKEQLFLAVRISRIKEIKPSLPVIFDDSFVNFDIAHTKNTVKALVQLSKTHQIFVLTCHASLVELIQALSPQALYFKLDRGKFTKSLGVDLIEHLKEL